MGLQAGRSRRSGDRDVALGVIAALVAATACGGPGAPSAGYPGQWTGPTSQGATIAFTISDDERVTSLSIGYNFGGCSGTESFSNLNLSIAPDLTCIPEPCPPNLSSFRRLSYSSGRDGRTVTINGVFGSTTRAEGTVAFRDFPACGSATGTTWTAARR